MTLRPRELQHVAEEIARTLCGKAVQKVVQPDESTVLLGLRGTWLLLSADARAGRMHLLATKPAGTGEEPPAFCMLLRKELTGLSLTQVLAVDGERAAALTFARPGLERVLRLYLYGPSAQLQLVAAGEPERLLGRIGPGHGVLGLPPPRPGALPPSRFSVETPSASIEAHYRVAADEEAAAHQETQRRAAGRKLERLVAALEGDRARAAAAVDKRKWGDLLLAHLAEVPRGASAVMLPDDFAEGEALTIPLDPARSARDNAQRYYREHKRLSRALDGIDRRLAEARERLARLASGQFIPPTPRQAKTQRARAERPPPYRQFRSATGAAILVGRGADRNDELTFKIARGNDLWLHTRDVPGAHVVVPLGGRPLDNETLLDAATLAAHHSNARGEAQVDVVYLPRKLVRKPPRSAAGVVSHAGGKTLRVRLEPARLRRLLDSRVDEGR